MIGSIGVFDSGVGGLSVLAEIRRLLPDAAITYVADQAHAPYGERSLVDVRRRAEAVTALLVDAGAALVVVACNSASAAALHHLRRRFPEIAFVGMEPAVKPAAASTRTRAIGVLATEATFQGTLFASVVDRHASTVAVVARACPGLATAVEDGDDLRARQLVSAYVGPLVDRGVDTIVLGCTHYSFLATDIAAVAGDGVTIVDPAAAVARRVAMLLPAAPAGPLRFVTTGDPERFAQQLRRLTPQFAGAAKVTAS